MPFVDILNHEGVRVRTAGSGEWVEGSRDEGPVDGPTFDCILFLPGPQAEQNRGGRQVKRPTLMFEPFDVTGANFELVAEDQVRLTAAEEEPNVRELIEGVWEVDGDPQPFGRPGDPVVGMQAALKRVSD